MDRYFITFFADRLSEVVGGTYAEIRSIFKKCGVDSAYISTGEDYVKPLIKLFESR